MRTTPALLAIMMLGAACGGTDTVQLRGPVEATPAAATTTERDTVDEALGLEDTDRYRWTISFEGDLGEVGAFVAADVFTVDVDRLHDIALIEIDYAALPEALVGQGPPTAQVAYESGGQLVRGLDGDALGWYGDGEPDPDTWYIDDDLVGDGAIPDIIGPDSSTAAVLTAIGLDPATATTVTLTADEVSEVDLDAVNLFAGLARADLAVNGAVWLEVDADPDGRLVGVRLGQESDNGTVTLHIALDYRTAAFEVPELEDGVPIPPAPWDDPSVTVDEPPSLDTVEPHRGALVRLNTYLGSSDLDVSLAPDGTLVRVARTDIFAGPDDFTQWKLSDDGVNRLLAAIDENPVIASGEYNVYYPQGVAFDVGLPPSELNAHPDRDPTTTDWGDDIRALIDLLADPSWLGDGIIAGPEPWIPETLTLIAAPSISSSDTRSWPLDATISEMGIAGSGRYEGSTVVCLEGADVAPVWALLGNGVNNAHVGLDDGDVWDGTFRLNWPGYRLFGDPCGPDYERERAILEGD